MEEFAKYLGISEIKSECDSKAFAQRKKEGKGCILCNYTGYITSDDNTCCMCTCLKNKFFKELYDAANVPKIYIGKTIKDWNTRTDIFGNDLGIEQAISEKVYTLISLYEAKIEAICHGSSIRVKHTGNLRHKLHSMKFTGGVGSGKTFIASVMVQSAINKKLSAKYYDWSDILDCIIDFNKKDELEDIIFSFQNCDFIAVDGMELFNTPQSHVPLQIDRLAKARINSGKPTFLLGSNTMDQIQGGSGWQSLVKNCLNVPLPNTSSFN